MSVESSLRNAVLFEKGGRVTSGAGPLIRAMGNFAVGALILFIVAGLIKERQLLTLGLLPTLLLVVLHNASGLFLGWATAKAMRVSERDRRAIMIEGGMQNSGLALGIIAVQFRSDLGMVVIASLWGMWHIVSGLVVTLNIR